MAAINHNPSPGRDNQSSDSENTQQSINTDNPQQGSDWNNYQTKEMSSTSTDGNISAEEAAQAFEEEQ